MADELENIDTSKNNESTILPTNNKTFVSLTSPNNAQQILDSISQGVDVELDVDKNVLLNNFNTFMLAEAYSQLPTIIKLHELQTKCLDKYYELINEMLEEDDANIFVLEKIINTLNNSIDRCNNIILRLGLNGEITDQLMIKHVDNSQNINVYQSQISKQKVIDAIEAIRTSLKTDDK